MIQLGHLYSKNKVFSNMNTNFLDDEDDCNWYGDTGGGGGEGRRDSMMKEHEQAPITFPYARATNKGTKHCYFPLPDFSYLQCPDANRDAVALLHGEVRLLRRPGKGGRDWRDCWGDRSVQRQEHGTSELDEWQRGSQQQAAINLHYVRFPLLVSTIFRLFFFFFLFLFFIFPLFTSTRS